MMGDLSEGLEARREDLVCPDPSRCYPKTAEDRTALQSGSVVVKGYRAKVRATQGGVCACGVNRTTRFCRRLRCTTNRLVGNKVVHQLSARV